MDITKRILTVIESKGLTKKEVAQKMGKFDTGFNKLITNPKWQTIEEVAQAMGMDVQELLFDRPATPVAEVQKVLRYRSDEQSSEQGVSEVQEDFSNLSNPSNPLNSGTLELRNPDTLAPSGVPDLILIDRATGETRKYVLLPQEAHA